MVDYPDDFSNYPLSLTEKRAVEENNARHASPRDAAIDLLREIDSKERGEVTAVVISYTVKETDGGMLTRYSASSPSLIHTLGLIERVKFLIISLL